MKHNKMTLISAAAVIGASMLASCGEDVNMKRPPVFTLPELPQISDVHVYKAPLYWSVYEYCYELERAGVPESDMDISPEEWDKILDWVARDLKPHGYDMVCTDGFIPMLAKDASGYMTHYGSTALKDLVAKAEARGLKVGVYDNPLWIHGDESTPIEGTDYTFANLPYRGVEEVTNPDATGDRWFKWAMADHPGAREYIDGFFKHYSDLGIKYIRMDFLSWYEDGKDRNMGTVGYGYGRASYGRALSYIAESAKKYGVFTSLVMPHLYNDAELEAQYGNMVRIVADTATGGWWHYSAADRGRTYANWPNCMNMFDGFIYWSHIAGKDKVILDGDFIRLNTFETEAEKQSVVSLQLMAGGPVTVSDQYHNIGSNLQYYTNDELLALNADRFVGHPLSETLSDANSQIWYGQMSDGSYVVGMFNREDAGKSVTLNLSDLGLTGSWNVRDLWQHKDEGSTSTLSVQIPARGCKIMKLTK